MTRNVIVIGPDRSILEAARKMAQRRIGGLVVVEHGAPIGLLTERDILWKVTAKERNPKKVLVRDAMASPVVTVSPLATLRAAARIMVEENVRRLVVTRLDEVEGIITARDVTEGFLESYAKAARRGASFG